MTATASSAPPVVASAFVDPASVAVVGATDDRAKWGHWLAVGALAGAHRRAVWLVNRRGTPVLGVPTYGALADLPSTPELVVVCVPAGQVERVVGDALQQGVRAFLVITAGLDASAQQRLAVMVRDAGARMVGPNSLGLYVAAAELRLGWGHFSPGSLAIVTQSGQVGSEIANLAARAGLGVSRFYSVGNQLDVRASELLGSLVHDPGTRSVALYLEGFADGAAVMAAVRELREAGKRTLLLTTGASDASRRLARSHTGSVTSALDVVDAACRASGATRVSTPRELVDLARLLHSVEPPAGPRVAVVSDSGGQGGLAADLESSGGLVVPVLGVRLRAGLGAIIPPSASTANPVDLAGGGEADLTVYARVAELLVGSGEIDALLLSGYLGCYGEDTPATAAAELAVVDRLGELAARHGVPVVVHSMSPGSAATDRMRQRGLPVFGAVEDAVGALARAVRAARPLRPQVVVTGHEDRGAAEADGPPGYWSDRACLVGRGLRFPAGTVVCDAADLRDAAGTLRAPLVLKAGWLEHKSEHGGVATGLAAGDLAATWTDMVTRLGPGEYVVEEQDVRRDVVEVLVGARRDPDFGPVVVVGRGGVETELDPDVVLELAPVDHRLARSMVDRLRCRPLLEGWRGRPAVDVDALVDAVVAVSELLVQEPLVTEVEVNPVRVGPSGAIAVDALVVRATVPSPSVP